MKWYTLFQLVLAVLLVGCSKTLDGSQSPSGSTPSTDALWSSAQANILDLKSFHARVGVAEPLPYWEIDFDNGKYDVRNHVDPSAAGGGCTSSNGTPLTGNECGALTPTPITAILESIKLMHQVLYYRTCAEAAVCEPWQNTTTNMSPSAGPAPANLPQFWAAAVGLAGSVESLGTETMSGSSVTHFRGSLNPIKARIQAEIAAGDDALPGLLDGLHQEEQRYEPDPATLDVWVSNQDAKILRVDLLTTFQNPYGVKGRATIDYLQFGGVGVSAPPS